jgi:hypothetical protein
VLASYLLLAYLASRKCDLPIFDLIFAACDDSILPFLACVSSAAVFVHLARPQHIAGLVAAGSTAGAAYAITFYLRGAREEEQQFVKEALGFATGLGRTADR